MIMSANVYEKNPSSKGPLKENTDMCYDNCFEVSMAGDNTGIFQDSARGSTSALGLLLPILSLFLSSGEDFHASHWSWPWSFPLPTAPYDGVGEGEGGGDLRTPGRSADSDLVVMGTFGSGAVRVVGVWGPGDMDC